MEFNKAVLDCMQDLRRRLKKEQQLNIRLSQPDAVAAMLAACWRSDDEQIRDLGHQLAEFSDTVEPQAQQATAEPVVQTPAAHSAHAPSVRIYRGQRVLG